MSLFGVNVGNGNRYAPAWVAIVVVLRSAAALAADPADLGRIIGPMPEKARLALAEDWSSGKIDPARWYMLRRMWGQGNHGVTPDNVHIAHDIVGSREQNVLICEAHGDQYDGPIPGYGGAKTRVGGVIVSKAFFASGRFEVVMKIGAQRAEASGPADPHHPAGAVAAIWTYAFRAVSVPRKQMDEFVAGVPLYNPLMKHSGSGTDEYSSEIDFPEFGKRGQFEKAMYNTYCQNRHETKDFAVAQAANGQYHTFTTEWRTNLVPIKGVTDEQVTEQDGFWWVREKSIPFERYLGNPLKRLGKDDYAAYVGVRVDHFIDGRKVAENTRYVPSMAAQLSIGVWLPEWAGPAPWSTATVSIASVHVWQYDDAGDVRGVLKGDVPENFDKSGRPME